MSNTRIAKNTLALYIRLLLVMGVTLFTSRIVLQALGASDYGIYTVVGGFVVLMIFMNNTLAAASSRFFSFELGRGTDGNIEKVFRSTLTIHLVYALLIVILLETFGVWFVRNHLTIPPERMSAALWVFHVSVFGAFISIVRVPLSSLIIATEKMKAFAYLGIIDVVIKLIVAIVLIYTKHDKLIVYAVLIKLSQIVVFFIYHNYCKRNITGYHLLPLLDKGIQIKIISYTAWSFIGSSASILKTQGVNILLNIFFGPSVNAARGIAYQVGAMLNNFTQKFTVAMNPQIVKKYAVGDIIGMNSIVGRGAKFSFFLVLLMSLPLLFHTELLLNLWLVEVPRYTVIFTKLLIINSLIDSFAYVMTASVQATGDVRKYQLVVGGMQLLNLPISYLLLNRGYPPVTVFYVSILLAIGAIFLRVTVIKSKIPEFSVKKFVLSVLSVCAVVVVLSSIPPYLVYTTVDKTWQSFIMISIVCCFSTMLSIWFVGLNDTERLWLLSGVRSFIKKTQS
ncbi:hypothetical protein QA601_10685 [Chitinispirillales bacterium ANBcel5]|uniref:hypothetical protein n=1 Tax=Cellulosispirillum alkaliphilum TaxID=3039283 RepID=UPI002A589B1F|nr:hypothetical protein [Chitinispirillales bacterium ANBcel5]